MPASLHFCFHTHALFFKFFFLTYDPSLPVWLFLPFMMVCGWYVRLSQFDSLPPLQTLFATGTTHLIPTQSLLFLFG
jgi:hypothetical protein